MGRGGGHSPKLACHTFIFASSTTPLHPLQPNYSLSSDLTQDIAVSPEHGLLVVIYNVDGASRIKKSYTADASNGPSSSLEDIDLGLTGVVGHIEINDPSDGAGRELTRLASPSLRPPLSAICLPLSCYLLCSTSLLLLPLLFPLPLLDKRWAL
jgi:hypothetical protein